MENDFLVSVIIPVFNVLPFLDEALKSVINQTYQNTEIIIIDDGSTDGSAEICDEYAKEDKRIIVIHQENRGLSAARNRGLDIMKGEMVAFLDSDDVYCPDYIASMLMMMNRDDTDIVICKYSIRYNMGKTNQDRRRNTYPSIEEGKYDRVTILRALVNGTVNHSVWNKLYKSYLWKEIRFPADCVYEDVDTTFRIINLCKTVGVLDRVLYLYRKRRGSILTIRSLKDNHDWVLMHDRFESFIIANTPNVFSEEQLELKKLVWGLELLYWYGYLSWKKNDEWIDSCDYLRKQILKVGKLPGYFAVPTIVGYWMVNYCPLLYRIIFPGLYYLHHCRKCLKNGWESSGD